MTAHIFRIGESPCVYISAPTFSSSFFSSLVPSWSAVMYTYAAVYNHCRALTSCVTRRCLIKCTKCHSRGSSVIRARGTKDCSARDLRSLSEFVLRERYMIKSDYNLDRIMITTQLFSWYNLYYGITLYILSLSIH